MLSEAACGLAEDYLRPYEISLAQWVVLSALWRRDGLSVSELSEYSGKKTAALSRLLDRLEDKELVRRAGVEDDKRSVKIHLTEKGRGLSHLADMYKHVNGFLLADLSVAEQEQLFPMLERMLDSVEGRSKKTLISECDKRILVKTSSGVAKKIHRNRILALEAIATGGLILPCNEEIAWSGSCPMRKIEARNLFARDRRAY